MAENAAIRSSLVADLLESQRDLSAVERFARSHQNSVEHVEPAQNRYYRDLIPLGLPGRGRQYSFEVDLDSCTGCKACVTACHSLNGLDDSESWRSVGLLVGGSFQLPVLQHVTGACHHCVEPACLDGCPVLAYEKDPVTGIVRHLDDQCIGCQYCILKCPYDVPKYNPRLGIVRKCDMCSERLATGEAPACVQACPTQAIKITTIEHTDAVAAAESDARLSGLPDPRYTIPTTVYKSARPLPRNVEPADYRSLVTQKAHWSLIVMLVLMQGSAGLFVTGRLLHGSIGDGTGRWIFAAGMIACVSGLVASLFHLGRPLYAFRAFLGLRRSWLSREVVAFGAFGSAATIQTLRAWLPGLTGMFPDELVGVMLFVGAAAATFCSVMVYHDTRRQHWHFVHSAPRFFLTAMTLGVFPSLLIAAFLGDAWTSSGVMHHWFQAMAFCVAASAALKFAAEAAPLLALRDRFLTPGRRSALLTIGPMKNIAIFRGLAGAFGGVFIPLLISKGAILSPSLAAADVVIACMGFAAMTSGELAERYLFFSVVAPPKMPGGMGS